MRLYLRKHTIPFLLIFLLACNSKDSQNRLVQQSADFKEISQPQAEEDNNNDIYNSLKLNGKDPKIPLPANEKPISIYEANLDLDPHDEQALIAYNNNNPENPLSLWVIDYDMVSESYSKAYFTHLKADNPQNCSLLFEDILGDHNLEIVVSGVTGEGHQSYEIFKKGFGASNNLISYTNIFSHTTPGSISIDRKTRSQRYREGQTNGVSFSIDVLEKASDSEEKFDLLKKTYYWRYGQNKYILTSTELLSGQQVEQQQLKDLFQSSALKYLETLGGTWRSKSSNQRIFIDPIGKEVSLITDAEQETYSINRTYKGIYNKMDVWAENELLPSVESIMTISFLSLDSIRISIWQKERWTNIPDEIWSGVYHKENMETDETLSMAEVSEAFLPAGLYKNQQGLQIFFDFPQFNMTTQKGEKVNGIASIFTLDDNLVFQLKERNTDGTEGREWIYQLQVDLSKDKYKETRALILQEGEISVSGVIVKDTAPIRLEQIEVFGDFR